jgi:hypothetical protein
MTITSVILATALAIGVQPFGFAQAGPGNVEGQTPPPQSQQPPASKPDATAVTFTGCVVPAPDMEDTLRFVPAEPEPGRPVGTAGTSPAWTVPGFLLLGGVVNFAEHGNKTVEITGIIEPPGAAVEPDPKTGGDTTSRTGQAAAPMARLQVQSVKIVSATCTPRRAEAGR